MAQQFTGQTGWRGWHSSGLMQRLALFGILALSAWLNLFRLHQVGINGIGNLYYAAAVKSMLTGWRHFFFLALDPAGFISVDKPPLALWIQAASARLFGFHGLSLLLAAWRAERSGGLRWRRSAFALGLLALLIAPLTWTLIPVVTCVDSTLPAGGPRTLPCKPFETRPFLDRDLITYLEENREGARYLAATYDMGVAGLGILETGKPFMAVGGYRGSDPILSADAFARLVAAGEVRFFVNMTMETESFPQQDALKRWVRDHCPPAPVDIEGLEVLGPCTASP